MLFLQHDTAHISLKHFFSSQNGVRLAQRFFIWIGFINDAPSCTHAGLFCRGFAGAVDGHAGPRAADARQRP